MRRIRLVHWPAAEAKQRAGELRAIGYAVEVGIDGPADLREMGSAPPNAVVIDLGRRPATGRDLGIAIRKYVPTRSIPLLFTGGKPKKVAAIGAILGDAQFVSWKSIPQALERTWRSPQGRALVPSSVFAGYAGRSLAKKLGIDEESKVALVDAPDQFERVLGRLPEKASVRRGLRGKPNMILAFVRSPSELEACLARLAGRTNTAGLWIVWPKHKPGVRSGIGPKVVGEKARGHGLTHFKIVAVDETWSAVRLARKAAS